MLEDVVYRLEDVLLLCLYPAWIVGRLLCCLLVSGRVYQIIILIAAAIIPIINVANIGDLQTRIISSIIGAIIVIITGITQLEKYQENWILYRTSAELLKKEKYFYENSAGEYSNINEPEKEKLLVVRVESIVSAETSKYFTIHQPRPKQPPTGEDSR